MDRPPGDAIVGAARSDRDWRGLGWLGLLALVGMWETVAWLLKPLTPFAEVILPPWETIFGTALPSLALLWQGPGGGRPSYALALLVLAQNSAATLARLLIGTTVGLVAGVGVGLLIGWSPAARALLWPTIQLTRPIPTLALIPLFMLWFGGREVGTWLYVGWATFSMMVVYTVEAVRNVAPVFVDYARTLGARRAELFRTVMCPAIVPALIGGIRVCLGVSWAIVLAAEYLGAQSGLGRILILSQTFFDTGRMVIIVLLFVGYALLLNRLVTSLLYRATRWVPA
jgi:ABC-type nitrate/sulfonate/bicarbonate transport system permease component